MGLDLKPKTWYWQQWLATIMFLLYLVVSFTTPYAFIIKLRFKVTLMTFIITVISVANYGLIVGAYVNLERKRYLIQLAAPPLLLIVELIFFVVLGNAVKVQIYYAGYLKYMLFYGLMILSFIICQNGVEYTYEYLTEDETRELGIDV